MLSAAIGFASALAIRAVMFLVNVRERLSWETPPQVVGLPYPALAICPLGGLGTGLWAKRFGGALSRFPA